LAQQLWDSVNEESAAALAADEQATLDEADRRDDELERGVVQPVSHEEIMAALRNRRFFSVEGLRVRTDRPWVSEWAQPIIVQPEIGVLGILVKRFDGVPHCLMQAKMEPGNINGLQMSPTVQATRSNYMKVHGGAATKYMEYFRPGSRRRVLFDGLQSEQGSWFLHKRNRNIVVETDDDVPLDEDFCWLTLDQIRRLLRLDHMVNMDSRTVLACVPPALARPDDRTDGDGSFVEAVHRSRPRSSPRCGGWDR